MKLLVVVLIAFLALQATQADMLDDALAAVGKSRTDLGYRPKGYWNRYPFEIPYKLPAFDDLFSEPLRVYDYCQSMKAAFVQYMQDSTFANQQHSALYQLTYHLAWERKIGGFRNFSANLVDTASLAGVSLTQAISHLYEVCGQSLTLRAFGAAARDERLFAGIARADSLLPVQARNQLIEWIMNLSEAYRFHQLAFRNVSPVTITAIHRIDDLDATQSDGQKYYPELDDCAGNLDWQSLVYAHFKMIAATDLLVKRVGSLRNTRRFGLIEFPTPLGRIRIGDDSKQTWGGDENLLILDLGGHDVYLSGAGSRVRLPFSVIVDLAGNDIYGDSLTSRSFGSGICGLGLLIDAAGDDSYRSEHLAQGLGIFGTGLLADFDGKDDYRLQVSGQGCGYFGVGMLIERSGDDQYYLAGDGQGAGCVGGGIGILADNLGDDKYTAEPYASVFNRGDYHSQMIINGNNAQGWGGGRRGDGSDGHSWAGGMGVLLDCYGNDEYYSGNWTLGCGYWFGIGILYDGVGNDVYRSCYFTQASGAHFCIGALFDEAGDDRHELFETAGAALSFGWDFAVTLLVDWQGNDSYMAKIISIACAQIRSNSLFFDFGGDDDYQLNVGSDGFGEATFREDFKTPRPTAPFTWYAQSYALLFDVGGADRYLDFVDSTKTTTARSGCGDNLTWYRPSRGAERFGFNNYGIGIDADSGRVDDLLAFPRYLK